MYRDMKDKTAVAVEGANDDWAAYIENETTRQRGNTVEDIANYGNKLKQEVAKDLFSDWAARLTYRP